MTSTSNFKAQFNGGTRANRFLVQGKVGLGTSTTTPDHTFHIRATFIPPITNVTLTAHAFGRKVNIPGDREYAPWQITVYDDFEPETTSNATTNPKNLFQLFHGWHENINSQANNTSAPPIVADSNAYKQDWTLNHLDLNGTALKTFKLIGCWPKTVGDIDFNMTRRNYLNTFSVIMLYDAIEITGLEADPTP